MTRCLPGEDLARFVDGDFDAAEGHGLEAHMADCARCSSFVADVRAIVSDLSCMPSPTSMGPLEADVASINLASLVLSRAALPPLRQRRWLPGIALATAAAAGLVVGLLLEHKRPGLPDGALALDEAGFQARGAGETPDTWVAIHPYLVTDVTDAPIKAVTGAIHGPGSDEAMKPGAAQSRKLAARERARCGSRLLFSYDNGGPRPYRYLMIFSVDGTGRLQWFFPEKVPGASSVAIEPGVARELHEEVPLERGQGVEHIHAVFSRAPLSIGDVERASSLRPFAGRLDLPDTGQHEFELSACGDD